ncbi:MAG: carboxypeptidase-like regulatory domain-containing protein [Candidatus Ozemobacteraceae bacterium]
MQRDSVFNMRSLGIFLFSFVLFGALVIGCGSNPTGPSTAATAVALANATGTPVVSTATVSITSGTLMGKVTGGTLGTITVNLWKFADYPTGTPIATTSTLSDGTYVFQNLVGGNYVISASADNNTLSATALGVVTSNGINNVTTMLLTPIGQSTGILSGRIVTITGAPLGSMTVDLYKSTNYPGAAIDSVKTLSDGTYIFQNLPVGTYIVGTRAENSYLIASNLGIVANNGQINTVTNTVLRQTDPSKGSLSGKIVTITGAALGGISVELRKSTDPSTATPIATVLTLSDGTYIFQDLDVGNYVINTLAANNYLPASNLGIVSTTGINTVTNTILTQTDLSKGSLSGKIVTVSGTPLGGISVELRKSTDAPTATPVKTTTLTDGTYLFQGLDIGNYVVSVVATGSYLAASNLGIVSTTGINTVTNTILGQTDPSKGSLSGKIVTVTGAALRGISVELRKSTDAPTATPIKATTLSDGTYLFQNLDMGNYIISIVATGSYLAASNLGTVSTTGINPVSNTILTQSEQSQGTLEGKIVSVSGTPLGNIVVNLWRSKDVQNGIPNGNALATATTLSDGTYFFPDLDIGNYVISIRAQNNYLAASNLGVVATTGINTVKDTPLTQTDQSKGSLAGKLVSVSGAAIGSISVDLYNFANYPNGTPIKNTTTLSDGTYLFQDLVVGTYVISTRADNSYFSASNLGVVSSNGVNNVTSTTLTQKDVPSSKESLTGKVVTKGGAGIGSISVMLWNVAAYPNGTFLASTTTLLDGTYIFQNLGFGNYIISTKADSNYMGASTFGTVSSAGNNPVSNIVLSLQSIQSVPVISVKGRLTARNGENAWSGAQIDLDTGSYRTVTSAFGEFTLTGVASGSHVITITKSGIKSQDVPFEVRGTNNAPYADGVLYLGQEYFPDANHVVDLGTIEIQFDVAPSANLTGTVKRSILLGGQPSGRTAPFGHFPFDLWLIDSKDFYSFFMTVIPDSDGTWQANNLPVYSGTLLPVAKGTIFTNNWDSNNGVYTHTVSRSASAKAPPSPIVTNAMLSLAFGYSLTSGKTTYLDLLVPVEYYTVTKAPTNIALDKPSYAKTDLITFFWDVVTSVPAATYRLSIRPLNDVNSSREIWIPATPAIFNLGASASVTINPISTDASLQIPPATYSWRVGAVDPYTGGTWYSDFASGTLIIKP